MNMHQRARMMGWALGLLGGACSSVVRAGSPVAVPPLALVPGGRFVMGGSEARPPRELRRIEMPAFRIGLYEVTVEEWAACLNDGGQPPYPGSPQLARSGDRFRPKRGTSRKPAAWISLADAQAYCRWLSDRAGLRARLPTEAEWEYAARGGLEGARFPWGWGAPDGRACFHAGDTRRVGAFPPNGYGLHDMAGNVFEWCAPEDPESNPAARGGSWSERDPRFLRVYTRVEFPADYRNADVGFRIVVEGAE